MSRRRKTVRTEQDKVFKKIETLISKLVELRKEEWQISDKEKQYVEEDEEVLVCGRPKKYETHRIGRVHWKDSFVDEDTDDVIFIERNMIVRQDGEWMMNDKITFKVNCNE